MTLGVFIATVAAAGWLYLTVSTGFFPEQDTGFLTGVMIAAQDSSFADTSQKVQAVAKVIAQDPAVDAFGMNIGSSSVNQASLNISLKPKEKGRKDTAVQVIARLRPKLAQVIGARTYLQAAQDIHVGGRGGQAQYQYTLSDADLTELNAWAPSFSPPSATLHSSRMSVPTNNPKEARSTSPSIAMRRRGSA